MSPSEYLRILADLRNDFDRLLGHFLHPDIGGDHASEGCFLTSAKRPTNPGFRNTVSLDFVAARHVGGATRFPLLTLSTLDASPLTYTPSGAGVPALSTPSVIYARMFMAGNRNDSRAGNWPACAAAEACSTAWGNRLAELRTTLSQHDRQPE